MDMKLATASRANEEHRYILQRMKWWLAVLQHLLVTVSIST
jgi:hypothetical protein